MGVGGQRHTPAALPPGKKPGTGFKGDWVGPMAGLDGWGKSRPRRESTPVTIQPVTSPYTHYALPTHYQVRDLHFSQLQKWTRRMLNVYLLWKKMTCMLPKDLSP